MFEFTERDRYKLKEVKNNKIILSYYQEKLLEEFWKMWNRYKYNGYCFHSDDEDYLCYCLILILEHYDYYMEKQYKKDMEKLNFYGDKK